MALSRRLRGLHERLVAGDGQTAGAVRRIVADSWGRSLAAGVAPDGPGAPLRLSGDELERARERSPLAPAVTSILETLSGLDGDARHVIAISDAEANLLWVSGEEQAIDDARAMGFCAGAAWSEAAAGTNAVGTAAALDHPIQIFSAEHVVAAVHDWTCSAAPVHDPSTGELIGVIDLTAELRAAHPHTLSLATVAASAAQSALRCLELEREARLRARWEAAIAGRRAASLLLDRRGRVIASRGIDRPPSELPANVPDGVIELGDGRVGERQPLSADGAIVWVGRPAHRAAARLRLDVLGHSPVATLATGARERALRSLEILALLAMRPDGLTAEQLTLAAYGERGKTVTVRAQVHRLRAHLGEQTVSTQPYRLNVPVDGDWLEVERLIAAGRIVEALRRYRGPMLPSSESPDICEARGLLEESLRRSILSSGDPGLLERWLRHPAGREDLLAARTLVSVLAPSDPRRAAATARSALVASRR